MTPIINNDRNEDIPSEYLQTVSYSYLRLQLSPQWSYRSDFHFPIPSENLPKITHVNLTREILG